MINDIQLEIEKIYNRLMPSIKNIINNYSYLNISQNKFEKLIKEIIIDIYNKNENKNLNKEIYIKKIKLYFESYIKITINNKENTNIIINNYINKHLILKDNNIDNQKELKKISKFLEKYQYTPSPDLYIELINTNKTLSSIIKKIIDEKREVIEKTGLEIITDDEIILTMLEVYCTIKNINFSIEEAETLNNIEEESNYPMLDSVKTYLLEIQKPLLKYDEEQKLFKRKSEGDEKARQILIEHNLKLVVSIAKKYTGRGLDILELIQEGNIGLMTAIDRFEYTKGLKLSTYATWWIRQAIQRALEMKTRSIRLPSHLVQETNKCLKTEIELEKELGRKPTTEEIAKKLNTTPEKVNSIFYYSQNTISLNSLIADGEETELGDLIPSTQNTPDEEFDQIAISEEIQKILKTCITNERELNIILLRCGFINGRKHTLEEIGKKYNLTRERIRQIEAKAINKLRKPKYKRLLLTLYSNNQHPLNTSIQNEEKSKTEEIKKIEPVKKNNRNINKEVNSLLEIFIKEGYTKEEISSIHAYLGEEDRKIIFLTNGNNLDNPQLSEKVTIQNIKDYNHITIPRIRTMLKTLYGIKNPCQLTVDSIIDTPKDVEKEKTKQKNNDDIMISTKKEEKKMKKNKMTIFENLGRYGYTKEEILYVIENLKESDKELIKLINGDDLENPTKSKQTTSKDVTKYHTNIIPKILRKLKKEYGSRETEYTKEKDKKSNPKEIEIPKEIEQDEPTNLVEKEEQPHKLPEESESSKSSKITKEEYIKILELIKTPTFTELMTSLNPKAAVIIALRLGYIDNKYFSTKSIAHFLEIEELEVIETTKEILNLYKEQINSFIDEATSYKDGLNKKRTLI